MVVVVVVERLWSEDGGERSELADFTVDQGLPALGPGTPRAIGKDY